MDDRVRDDEDIRPESRLTVWLKRALLLGAVACLLLAIWGGLRQNPVLATVPTYLQTAAVLLLTAIVLLLDEIRADRRATRL